MHAHLRLGTVAAAVVGAVVCLALATRPAGELRADRAATRRAIATPLWSARRVPGLVVDPLTSGRERQAGAALERALTVELGRFGAGCAVAARGSAVVAAVDPDAALVPASTQKLLTMAAAVERLGPEFRFVTRALADQDAPVLDRLWLVGSGDPVIRTDEYATPGVTTPLEVLADAVVAHGVRSIGTVVGDDSRYDSERFLPTWSPSYRAEFDVGPLGALTVTQGVALVDGRPVMTDDPARFAAAELSRLLRARGVVVGEPTRGVAPENAVVMGAATSQPLRAIVPWVLATSDNLAAELLTKELGVRVSGEGTTRAGVDAIRAAMVDLGVPMDRAVLVDGSGLDRANRLTCRTLLAVVDLGTRPGLTVLRDALPGAARVSADGLVRAKGGYLNDVTGLAGVVASTPTLRFAFLVNGGVPKTANTELARIAAVLAAAEWPAPVPDSLVPEPQPSR